MTAVDHAELKRLAEGLRAFEGSDDLGNGDFTVCEFAADGLDTLLSEIEGLKAELDALIAVDEEGEGLRQESRDRTQEAERQLADLRTQAPDSWRPIETAPKDGMAILACNCEYDGGLMECVFWMDEHWHTSEGIGFFQGRFTHWMPLPAAPAFLRPQTAGSA